MDAAAGALDHCQPVKEPQHDHDDPQDLRTDPREGTDAAEGTNADP